MQITDLSVPGFDLNSFEREFDDIRLHFLAALQPEGVEHRESVLDAVAEIRRRSRKAAELIDKIVAAMPAEEQPKASRTATFVRGRAAEAGNMLRELRALETRS